MQMIIIIYKLNKTIRLNSGKPIAMEVKRKEFNESDTPNRNNY